MLASGQAFLHGQFSHSVASGLAVSQTDDDKGKLDWKVQGAYMMLVVFHPWFRDDMSTYDESICWHVWCSAIIFPMTAGHNEILWNFQNPPHMTLTCIHAVVEFSYTMAAQAHHLWAHTLSGNPRLQECTMLPLLSNLVHGGCSIVHNL